MIKLNIEINNSTYKKLIHICSNDIKIINEYIVKLINEDMKKQYSKEYEEMFAIFWSEYPNKKGRLAAEKAWKKINPSDELFNYIMNSIRIVKKSEQWTSSGGKYIPHPSTWLNNKRWEDEINIKQEKKYSLEGWWD